MTKILNELKFIKSLKGAELTRNRAEELRSGNIKLIKSRTSRKEKSGTWHGIRKESFILRDFKHIGRAYFFYQSNTKIALVAENRGIDAEVRGTLYKKPRLFLIWVFVKKI